ncbi:MAG: hypothetical protein F9K29_00655 [Hyphomicrobiaceae bacterium]|nr:MAG: hypothetical protein F9K29_00655 [Hyphomicrobiaceae bacterium]
MTHKSLLAIVLGTFALLAWDGAAEAGERRGTVASNDAVEHPKTRYYRKKSARVYGYTQRRGGYSYDSSDVVNTYSLTRNLYGSTNSYRNPWVDRQTTNGPFDHGFFFDSGIAPRGGDSPYLR